MKVVKLSAAVLALGLVAFPVAAQVPNNPVYFSPKGGVGLTINGDLGVGANDAAKQFAPGETPLFYGGRAVLGLPLITVGVGAGIYAPGGAADNEVTFQGTVAYKLIPMPVAVSIQAGAGYVKLGSGLSEATIWNFPIGVGIALNVPSPALSVEPWIAPRVQFSRASIGSASSTETHFGASAGVNLGLPMGLGFHAAVDYLAVSSDIPGVSSSDVSPLVVGVGVHYKISVPGLGMM